MQIKTRLGIFIPSLIENVARLPVFNALRVTRLHVPEKLFMRNNSIYQEGGGEIDWGTFCYPLTRAIRWGGEQDLVISPEINQCKRVQILLPALPRGRLNKSISPHSFLWPPPGASACQKICIFHLTDYHWEKRCEEMRKKLKLSVWNCVLPGKPWGEKRSQRLSWCVKTEIDMSLKNKIEY